MKTASLLVKQPALRDGNAKKKDDMKKKIKRYQDGGMTYLDSMPQAPSATSGYFGNTSSSYPFQSSGVAASSPTTDAGSGVNQTFNIQPTAQAGQPQGMKRGGKVSASKRADGCAIRGKTRA
jgi:hypothetical protein